MKKKKGFALIWAAAMSLSLLAGCGGSGGSSAPVDTGGSGAAGGVYYLNFKPEADEAWQALARTYTEQTGVPVKVVTAASGTYSDTLTAEMGKTKPPTIFNIGNAAGMEDWGDCAIDLTGSAVFDERVNDDYVLYDDAGVPKALGYCYESFGIIVNKALLAQAGHSLDEIRDFDSLKAVADDIHANAAALGFDAFSAPGLERTSSWRFSGHLANVPLYYEYRDGGLAEGDCPAEIKGAYLDNYRKIWDLYITDTAVRPTRLSTSTGDESAAQFAEGRAVFYQNGDWEFSRLTEEFGMNPDDLAMIPIYCGVAGEDKAGLCSGTENHWAVNAHAGEEEIKNSLDFLYWVVTSDEGTAMMSEQFSGIPFKAAKPSVNVFGVNASDYASAGNYTMFWAFNDTPNAESWRATVVTALAAYAAKPSDANWETVVSAFVDGWAIEYDIVNG